MLLKALDSLEAFAPESSPKCFFRVVPRTGIVLRASFVWTMETSDKLKAFACHTLLH
jgi:hypothetical protein